MNLYTADTNEQIELPSVLETFRGHSIEVVRIEVEASGGTSGKILVDDGVSKRTLYPGVVGCYIAAEPRVKDEVAS